MRDGTRDRKEGGGCSFRDETEKKKRLLPPITTTTHLSLSLLWTGGLLAWTMSPVYRQKYIRRTKKRDQESLRQSSPLAVPETQRERGHSPLFSLLLLLPLSLLLLLLLLLSLPARRRQGGRPQTHTTTRAYQCQAPSITTTTTHTSPVGTSWLGPSSVSSRPSSDTPVLSFFPPGIPKK